MLNHGNTVYGMEVNEVDTLKDLKEMSQWVTFTLHNEFYGMNVMQVKEVLRHTHIAPVPGSAEYILGILNLRGNVVTVVDMRRCFHVEESPISEQSRIIIAEIDKQVFGVLVDSVQEVVYLQDEDIDRPTTINDEKQRFVQGLVNHQERLLILVELNKLISVDRHP